jgi:polyhydroxyalkanoate synthesis regulator protein
MNKLGTAIFAAAFLAFLVWFAGFLMQTVLGYFGHDFTWWQSFVTAFAVTFFVGSGSSASSR